MFMEGYVAYTLCCTADMPHGAANTLDGAANTATFTAFTSVLSIFENSDFLGAKKH